jgi:flagellar basal body-associated protein FliL
MKNTDDQAGIAHIQLIIGMVLVVGVVSFAGYRVGQSTRTNQQLQEIKEPIVVTDVSTKEAEQKAADIVEVPPEEKALESTPVPVPAAAPKKVEATPKTEVKKEKVYVEMSKVSAVQNGTVLNIHSRLASAQTGTCNFKLYQEGYEKVYASIKIQSSNDCIGGLSVAGLPTYSGWSLHVWFDGSDGKTNGYQKEEPISLVAP